MRRNFLKAGALAGVGLVRLLQSGQRRGHQGQGQVGNLYPTRRRCHMDSFDMKPDAPDSHRGEFKEISTNVPGIRISTPPRWRSVRTNLPSCASQPASRHISSEYLMTGNRPFALKYPTYGAVIARNSQEQAIFHDPLPSPRANCSHRISRIGIRPWRPAPHRRLALR